MKSLKDQLYDLVSRHYPNFMNGGEAERYAMDNGFKASNASRRLRELAQEGKLWRRENGGSVEYLARFSPKIKTKVVPHPLEARLF